MIREIDIQEFKAWNGTGPIRMAPLTIFCGTNSSGKSSIAQFLLMLKQTVESYDRRIVLNLGEKDSLVDLGSWSDIIHKHKVDKHIYFDISFDTNIAQFKNILEPKRKYGPYKSLRFYFIAGFSKKTNSIAIEEMTYELNPFKAPLPPLVDFRMEKRAAGYVITSAGYELAQRNRYPLPPPENFYGFPSETATKFENADFLPDLSLAVNNLFRSICYVGPIRQNPARQYQFSGDQPTDVGIKGEKTINAILAVKDKKISIGLDEQQKSFQVLIATCLKKMKLIHSFRIVRISKTRKDYEVKIKIAPKSSEVLITDVGFGISQILPVIVQCFYAPANSIQIFEQPEIHLHPSVQSNLADILIDAIHAREDDKPRNNQLIVESHSEHLIRRIQRRIAEGTLKTDEVAVYFVNQESGEAQIKELQIDNYGNITNWPENFFGNDLEDLIAMNDAARKRKIENK